jgi:hypothetical protein
MVHALGRRAAPPHALASALVSVLVACGGAADSAGGPKTGGRSGGDPAKDVSIADIAAAQGGLASLGGAGNREAAPPGRVDGTFRLDLIDKGAVKVDGVLGEWPARLAARQSVRGGSGASFAAALQYDDAKIYIAGEVSDRKFVRTSRFGDGEDRASLVLAFPSGGTFVAYELGLYAGSNDVGGEVRWLSGGRGEVQGARIVEAPASGGYTFEAQIPWSAFPEARTTRVGLRGVARYYDGDGAAVRAILATGPGDAQSPRELPWLPTEPEQSLIEGLLIPKQLSPTPRAEIYANLSGDARKERVAVYDHFFTICGPSYRQGKEFFFRDLAADLVNLEARDVTGRGKDDLLVRRRFKDPGGHPGTREWFEVWSFFKGDEPVTTFAHEIAVANGAQHVANAVHVRAGQIEVTPEPAAGWDATTYREPVAVDVEPILLPWGSVASQTFRFDGTTFTKAKEIAKSPAPRPEGAPSAAPARPVEPPTPPVVVKPGDTSRQLLEQFKRDHGVDPSAKPRVDLQVHVDGDPRPERIVLLGRDLVVFGPGFRGGGQYTSLTLSAFTDPADVKDVSARDLTGDGAADLIVRGVRHVGPTNGGDSVDAEVMLVYQINKGQIGRIFAIETAREQGARRVQGLVQFIPARGGKTFDIDVRPGVAKGWTQKTYPWQEDPPGGAMEPLLLPWGTANLRYAWSGTAFTLAK